SSGGGAYGDSAHPSVGGASVHARASGDGGGQRPVLDQHTLRPRHRTPGSHADPLPPPSLTEGRAGAEGGRGGGAGAEACGRGGGAGGGLPCGGAAGGGPARGGAGGADLL